MYRSHPTKHACLRRSGRLGWPRRRAPNGRARALARANRHTSASRRVSRREPPHPKGFCPSAGHRAFEGALAGGSLREPRQVVPQVRRELIRKADALRESQRTPDKYVSHREALADEIIAAIQGAGHRARGLIKALSRSSGAVGVALSMHCDALG